MGIKKLLELCEIYDCISTDKIKKLLSEQEDIDKEIFNDFKAMNNAMLTFLNDENKR